MKKIIYFVMAAVLVFSSCADNSTEDKATTAKIHGSVVANGEPVNAAAVLLTPGGGTKITGSDGIYDFSDLQPGRYELKIYKEGFQSFNKSIDIAAGKDEELAITLSASTGKLSLNKAYIDMGSNESNNVAGFSIKNSGDIELAWSITNAAGWISKIEPKVGTVGANSATAVVITIDRSKLSTNSNDNHASLVLRSTTAGDGSTAELLVTVFGNGNGTNTTISNGDDYVVIGDLFVQTKDLGKLLYWTSANNLCNNSIVGDYNDWRLPTLNELATIYTQKEVIGGFDKSEYWSSDEYSYSYSIYHYLIDFSDGQQSSSDRSYNARAVRKDISPEVTVLPSNNMTETSIVVNGKVVVAGAPAYTERGFVYGTEHNPTLSDTKVISYTSKSDSTFSATINGLTMGTTYYVRTYATNKNTTGYSSDEVTFTISNQRPQVSTLPVDNITETAVTLHGSIDSKGIPPYTEKGFCYSSTFQNPTIDEDKKVVSGSGIGEFTANISELTTGTTYYVRAYATNSEGTAYGSTINFKPSSPAGVVVGNLMVQLSDIALSSIDWTSNSSLCQNSTLGGYTGWRLPTIGELSTLYTNRTTIGGFSTTNYYASSTSSGGSDHYFLNFANGSQIDGYTISPKNTGKARCVRTLP